ncbi:MAG: hypothetical protein RBG13Loki_1472 [Promethearchaeota archaeon CR_4]|nr:MAG: hypothetical protein RBG13Loki_1472 [Candidatus Lokiarchaeota archaeon CR_4]
MRELLLFGILFGALILQGWANFLLPLFAILSFSIAIFVRGLTIGQEINYAGMNKPLLTVGLREKVSDRLELASILTLLTVLIQGYESLARPQMSAILGPYFLQILLVTYLLGFYWLFSVIQIESDRNLPRIFHNVNNPSTDAATSKKDLLTLRLKIASYSTIIIAAFLGIGTIFNILTAFNITPTLLISVPGSVLTNGSQISFNGVFLVVLFGAFATAIINLAYLLKNIQVVNPRNPLVANIETQAP